MWVTSPTSNQRMVRGSVMPAWTAMSMQQHHALAEETRLGVAVSLLHQWNPQASTMWNPRDPILWHREFRVWHLVPRSLTFCWVTHRSTGSLGSYGPHFPHLWNAGKSIYHIKVVVKIQESHSYLICQAFVIKCKVNDSYEFFLTHLRIKFLDA